MKVYTTENGALYWGRTAEDIVLRMRLNEFRLPPRESNEEYMQAAADRVAELERGTVDTTDAESFVASLVELKLLEPVDRDLECPRANTICGSKRDDCADRCWLKKHPINGR